MKQALLSIIALFLFAFNSIAQVTSTASGGNWGDNSTWVGGIVPLITDDVIIADGALVIINITANAQSLQIGQGSSGILEFESVNPQTLTVLSDITILAGAIFRSSLSGNQSGHELFAGANLVNNGTLDFSTNGNTAAAGITFTGAANATFSGAGAVSDISRITINKGTDATSVLELNPDAFSFEDAAVKPGTDPGYLDIINGMFKISGTFTMENGLFTGTVNYTVPPSGGIWFNNPNYTVAARAGTGYMEGTLIMDAGIYNVGTAVDNRLGYIDGSVITINGGTVNVASRFSATTTFGLTYTQTGGTFTVNTVGSSSVNFASFDIRDLDVSTFNMSGGTIVLQNPGAGGAGPRDYLNRPAISNITGGTLIVGNSLTAPAQTFYLQGIAPNLQISNTTGGHTAQLFNNLQVLLNTTINPGTTIKLDDGTTGYQYAQQGTFFINTGTLDGSVTGSRLFFQGSGSAQTYTGNGTVVTPLSSLEINNPLGVTIANSIASELITNELVMTDGDINTGINTLVLGTSTVSTGIYSYLSGTIVGNFKRWIPASTGLSDFPVGISGTTRNANINFTSAPVSGGTLTASWISFPGADNGLPLIDGIYLVTNTSSEGYWSMIPGDGLSGGVYTGTFNANNLLTITDFSQLVLVKRTDNSSPWVLDGIHVPSTGSNAAAVLQRTGMAGFSEFGIGGNISSLPITIEYFKGIRQSNTNRLEWKVSCNGSPSALLTLERSADSRNFSIINSENATALRCLQPFYYTDLNPTTGINYYRVKMSDADGRNTYSSIVALSNKASGFDLVGIMPNPVVNTAVLSIVSANTADIQIVVTDMSGRKVILKKVKLSAGSNPVILDCSNMSSGTYQVTVIHPNGELKTVSFIKQ